MDTIARQDDERLYSVTELATALGITARAIRFYEDKGLISPSRVGCNRVYTYRERARMRLILRGKALGFSLAEIKDFLDLYNADPMHRTQTEALLGATRDRIVKLRRMQAAIDRTLDELHAIETQTMAVLAQHPGSQAS